jgi:DNA-binding transcriptional LysR family regulator
VLGPRMPELSALEVLVTVAGSGSLNAAAARLGVSQQAVSARISAIEALVGVTLVRRTSRGSSLTPAGAAVSEWAIRLLEHAEEVDAGLAALRGDARRTLRVAASLTISEYLLPGWLVALRQEAELGGDAHLAVHMAVGNSAFVAGRVATGESDVGFVEGATLPRVLRSRVIGEDGLAVVVPPGHAWARPGARVSPSELAATPLVAREQGSGTREVLTAALQAAARSPSAKGTLAEPAIELPTTSAVRAAVVAGAGPAVLSYLAVEDDVTAGRLVLATIDGLDLRRKLRAVWVGPTRLPPGPARDLVALAGRLMKPTV